MQGIKRQFYYIINTIMATQEHTYTFELDYDKVDYTVDTVLKKVTDWQKNF